MNGKRIIGLDEINAREAEIWRDFTSRESRIVADNRKRVLRRSVYRLREAITYGFAPLVYTTPAWDNGPYVSCRQAMCLTCGHVVATNQPSWMRKHAADKHGLERLIFASELIDV